MQTKNYQAALLWAIPPLLACTGSPPPVDNAVGTEFAAKSNAVEVGQEEASATSLGIRRGQAREFGAPPTIQTGPFPEEVAEALDTAFGDNLAEWKWDEEELAALGTLLESGDVRLAWAFTDLIRVSPDRELSSLLILIASELMGPDFELEDDWGVITDHLIAWDIPAPPGYVDLKRRIYSPLVPQWESIIQPGQVDWRLVTWGGVRIDDRAYDTTDEPCNCIPAIDNPETQPAAEATWLKDSDIVFGIVVGDAARAYPRRIMEVREMVNDTLGGRDLAIPYCTLCASAQAFFTDQLPEGVERPILRTSGLLSRSNKVMYDVRTYSVFDTFLGTALTGPLATKDLTLPQTGVVTTTFGEWKAKYPDTDVLVESLALGRDFDFRNGRDADGPIFPIGDVDDRLAVQEDILGIVASSGTPVAFHVTTALETLREGGSVAFENVRVVLDGGGLRAVDSAGEDLGGHQAFWFAWSQFYPDTELWPDLLDAK